MDEQEIIVQNISMEEGGNVKELSIEDDILGAQSLLMSESDEDIDDNTQSPRKKISTKITKRILDSDDDDNVEREEVSIANQEYASAMNNKKISALMDSDSDDCTQGSRNENPSEIKFSHLSTYKEGDAIAILKLDKSPKNKCKNKKNRNAKIGDQELETSSTDDPVGIKKTKNHLSLIDSESSDHESETENQYDLESSAREAHFENNNNEVNEKVKKMKVVRASTKKAIDEMQAIQSEQQRLHREAHISIPYHKPRKYTLDEFLMRRTIIQPQKSSPVAETIQKRSLKMTTEELEEYAKLMEERAKEAKEFFKSESENEDNEVFTNKEDVLDRPEHESKPDVIDISEHEIADDHNNSTNNLTKKQDRVQLTDELETLTAEEDSTSHLEKIQEERPTCSKFLITEVIELPKLDMNTVQINPPKKCTPRTSLNIKQLIAEKKLSESPSLRGNSSKLIDLETGDLIDKKPTAMDNLMKRLMSTIKARKAKNFETCSILSVENGKLEMSKVNINRTEVNHLQKDVKPGAAYFELKRNLKEIIKRKRLDEMNKKQEEELEYNKCLDDDDQDYEEDETEDVSVEDNETDDKSKSNVIVVDEEENTIADKDDGVDISVDEEDEEDAECDGDGHGDSEESVDNVIDIEDKDDEVEEGNEISNDELHLDKSQRKKRIIKAFDDTDEEEEEGQNDDIDFLKTQPPTTQPPILETQVSVKTSLENDERELMALCSGTFDDSQKTSGCALMSQIPITQNCGKQINDEELMQLCSGTFDRPSESLRPTEFDQISENVKAKCNKISSSDEENYENSENEILSNNEINKHRVKKLTKRLKKRKAKLGFSDDEDDEIVESDCDRQGEEEVDDNLEMNIEEPDTFIDYDSEENEILVKMKKDDKVMRAQNFVENEAELSESEWGSADEDENNLDKYDIELGDEDEFDKEKLRTELGQIHARKMLDEDIREVRKIQEMLFEDEEKDGVGRQRTFKWKNAENGFSIDDGRPLDETGNGQNGDSGDELNEHQWRKVRYEREQFLKEQGLKADSQDLPTIVTNTTGAKKLQIICTKKTALSTTNTKKGSPFLISRGISGMHKKSVRSSFLVRDKETLNKLAGLAKISSSSIAVSDIGDTSTNVTVKNSRPTNFVFATLTEEEHESIKRKADDFLNSSNENGKNFIKKPKTEPRRNKCFIDQLL